MRTFLFLLTGLAMSAALTFGSCTFTSAESDADKSGPEYTSHYVCPMHCEGSGSVEAGDCPVCGMDYVKNDDLIK